MPILRAYSRHFGHLTENSLELNSCPINSLFVKSLYSIFTVIIVEYSRDHIYA